MNIHIQLNCLIEVQYNILNMIRQKVNFLSIFIKPIDSNEFESESEININIEKNISMIEQI